MNNLSFPDMQVSGIYFIDREPSEREAIMLEQHEPYNQLHKQLEYLDEFRDEIQERRLKWALKNWSSPKALKPYVEGDVYVCMSSSELHTLQRAFRDCGGHFSTFIIWVKNQFTIGRANYQRQYEPILYGWFEGTSHYWS